MGMSEEAAGRAEGQFLNKSEAAFEDLQKWLKTNPRLSFAEGFHEFPQGILSPKDSGFMAERVLMFTAPKTPILDLKKLGAFTNTLMTEFNEDSKMGEVYSFQPIRGGLEKHGYDMQTGGLSTHHELIGTVKMITTHSLEGELPPNLSINMSPSVKEISLEKGTAIFVFPDITSAAENAAKFKSSGGKGLFQCLTSEQIKQLEKRNKQKLK
jgi:hypothetical protein